MEFQLHLEGGDAEGLGAQKAVAVVVVVVAETAAVAEALGKV